jgi:hypothetical protein
MFSQVQVELPQRYVRDSKLNSTIENVDYKGSPYLYENFVPGTLKINKEVFNVSIRYNAYQDEFEMKNAKDEIVAVLKKSDVDVQMGNQIYKLLNYNNKLTYFEILSDGVNMRLLKKDIKKFMEAKEAENSYSSAKPAKFVLETNYYLQSNNSITPVKLNKKSILAQFDKKAEVTKFIKLNKLRLKTEDDIKKLLIYYNTL